MGNDTSRPESVLRSTDREVNSLRSSLRGSRRSINRDTVDNIVKNLAKKSQQVTSLKGKVKQTRYEKSMKNISEAMNEVLNATTRESALDQAAVETDSFVHTPVKKDDTLLFSTKKSKPITSQQHVQPSLNDIETKLDELARQIERALGAKDVKQLRFCKQSIRVLAADLEMIDVQKGTAPADKKKDLGETLSKYYRKIEKSTKELKRNENIEYLSSQQKKESCEKELEEIEKNLAENETLLDRHLNTQQLQEIKTNITHSKSKLASIDNVGNPYREKQVLLSQKVARLIKDIDSSMSVKQFDESFIQAINTYDAIMNTLNKSDDKAELKEKLESLQKSVNNLVEYNDTSKRQKQELLGTIQSGLGAVIAAIQKEEDQRVVQQIVEENVILRRKNRKSTEVTQIDQFYNYWNNVKNNINLKSCSMETLSRITTILHDMTMSMNALSNQVEKTKSTKTNLLTQQSQSVPKLSSGKKTTFGSTKSLDTEAIIKTNAKYYNISTPALLHVNEDLRFRNAMEKNRFSEIEEIKSKVYYIKEKIDDVKDKHSIKNNLKICRNKIQAFRFDENETIATNVTLILSEIQSLLNQLDTTQKMTNGRMFSQNYLEILSEAQKGIEQAEQDISAQDASKVYRNLDSIKLTLFEIRDKLRGIHIEPGQTKAAEEYEDLNNKISDLLNILDHRSAHENIKIVQKNKEKLLRLKQKVQRFSGTYKGVLYNTLEMDLNKLLLDAENVQDQDAAEKIIRDTEKYLKILEQKATKIQSFRGHTGAVSMLSNKRIGMGKIKKDLASIKKEIDRTPEEKADSFVRLRSRLDLVNLELDQISIKSTDSLEKDKDVFSNEAQTLINVVDAKIALSKQPLQKWSLDQIESNSPKFDSLKEIAEITENVSLLKNKVSRFSGLRSDPLYMQLEHSLSELASKTDGFKFIRGTDLYTQKLALLQELKNYHILLEQKVTENELLTEAENSLNKIEISLQQNPNTDCEEEVIGIQQKLLKANVGDTMNAQKNNCLRRVSEVLESIKQLKNTLNIKAQQQKVLDDIEEEVKKIKLQVESYTGETGNTFSELDETIMTLILNLEKFDVTHGSEFHIRKIALLKELHSCGALLDARLNDIETLIEVQNEITNTCKLIDEYSGSHKEYESIDNKMKNIQKRLEHIQVGPDFTVRKNACKEHFSVIFNKFLSLSYKSQVETSKGEGFVSHTYTFVTQNKSKGELSNIERQLEDLKTKVLVFNDEDTSEEYRNIDDKLTELTFKLNSMTFKSADENNKKATLMRYIQECTDIMDERAVDISSLVIIERKLNDIGDKILNEHLSDDNLNQLDEQLISIQVKLGKLNVNPDLKNRKDQCLNMVNFYFKQITDIKKKRVISQ